MSDHDRLKEIPCPNCGECNLFLGSGLLARSIGSFSLSGAQMKVSAHTVPALRCSTPECAFIKFPKGIDNG
jgi:hypothetical protein